MSLTREEDQIETEVFNRYETGGSVFQREADSPALDLRRRQRKLIEDLTRLQDTLRGPELLLDRTNYSRPFPPPSREVKQYEDTDRPQEDPSGRTG